jgi:mono/diheme cytochrome c family protein
LLAVVAVAADKNAVDVSKLPPASTKTGITFDADIKPLFEKACFKCHGPETEKPKGKFKSWTREFVLKGGGEGACITPGDVSKSSVMSMITWTHSDEEMYMPPKDNKAKIPKLTNEQIGLVRAWIEQGAK